MNISLSEAIRNVCYARKRVYDLECQVIIAEGNIPVSPPDMENYNSIQQCITELDSLKVRFENAHATLAKLYATGNEN